VAIEWEQMVAAKASGRGSESNDRRCRQDLTQLFRTGIELFVILGRRQLTTQIEDPRASRLKIFAVANVSTFLTIPPHAGWHLFSGECFDEHI